MVRSPTIFKKADVKRAIAGARAAGMTVGRVEVEAGKIVVHAAQPNDEAPKSPLDEWRAARDSR